jgi:hypothetical protein
MDEARAVIKRYHDQVPANLTYEERKRHLRQLCPGHFRQTSWGRKVWPKAVAEYLNPYGPKSDVAVPVEHLSPLERMMRRAGA